MSASGRRRIVLYIAVLVVLAGALVWGITESGTSC